MRTLTCLLLFVLGCTDSDPPLPTCEALGCPLEPSGSPEAWEPCQEALCWCNTTEGPAECLDTNRSADAS